MKKSPILIAQILQSTIVKAQVDHNFSRSIVEYVSISEYGMLGIVRAFLATYGVIRTLYKNLPKVEAEELERHIKEIEMGIFSSESGMTKDRWTKMYEYISGELHDVMDKDVNRKQKVVELGTLLLSAACIERDCFAELLVIECGEQAIGILNKASSETYSQLLDHGLI